MQRPTTIPEQEDAPIISESMMGSRLPDSVRPSNPGHLSLYQTFRRVDLSPNQDQSSNLANTATPQELDYGLY